MKTYLFLSFLSLQIIQCSFISLFAQVTIGSNAVPATAALLQVKDQEADEDNVTSRRGGVLLPRVALENINTLSPFLNMADTTGYAVQRSKHVGLLVYNVKQVGTTLYPGLYVWDGERWDMLAVSAGSSGNADNPNGNSGRYPTSASDERSLIMPNSYIAQPGATISIPIIKAYGVWKQMLGEAIDTTSDVSVGLLWQDERSLVSSVSLVAGSSVSASQMSVTLNNQGIEGNAVVYVKVAGIVRWSWHIWVTRYTPDSDSYTYNQNVFMDRNLGAVGTIPGSVGSFGLLYQWGRKDPFPNSSKTTSGKENTLYSITNDVITGRQIAARTVSPNLENSIINPKVFYTDNSDWYAATNYNNKYLWSTSTGTKGIYDPCPDGWRVPISGGNTNSVWSGLPAQTFVAGTGVEWSQVGFYPAAGRINAAGNYENTGTHGYVWAASYFYDKEAYKLEIETGNVYSQYTQNRVYGASVRCVKDAE